MNPEYVPENLLITGGAGFIMSHVVDACLEAFPHVTVYVYDVMDYCASEKNLTEALKTGRCELIRGDVRDLNMMCYVLKDKKIDTVIHGAAVSHVDLSFGNPLMFTETNTVGTQKLLEAMCKVKVHRCIIVSTDEVYGSNDSVCSEDTKFNATNPYSASKAAMECFCQTYIRNYQLPLIITRGNNVMGERQYPEKLIPKFISLLERGKPLTIHGSGNQLRSYMYVKDCAQAFVCLLKRGKIGEVYNIEAGCELTVNEVTRKLLALYDKTFDDNVTQVKDRNFNDQRYFINGEKLKQLGWDAKTTFDECLPKIVEWYKKNRNYWPHIEAALEPHPKFVTYG